PRWRGPVLGLANVVQTIPSLALFGFLIPLPLIGGIGARTAAVALVLYGLLPIVRNTYTGITGVDAAVREAGRGMGMTDRQLLLTVDLPLALGVILAGAPPAERALLGRGTRTVGTIGLSLSLLLVTACGHRDRVVVGAKNFTESDLLAEIVGQQIERRTHLRVERRFHLGGTFVCHEAITSGRIDLYVEYTGTAYTAVLKRPPPSIAAPESVYGAVARDYAQRFGLRWGKPFGFDNTFAITVRRRDAERYALRRISDLARVAPRWKAGFGYEFLERADGFQGLSRAYGLAFAAPPTALDLGLTYRALADGKVDVIAGNSTDGQIAALHLVALRDEQHYFPPYEAAPVVR